MNNAPITRPLASTRSGLARWKHSQTAPTDAMNISANARSDVASGPCASMLGLNTNTTSVTIPPRTPNSRRAHTKHSAPSNMPIGIITSRALHNMDS
jgi:hypothetical protein